MECQVSVGGVFSSVLAKGFTILCYSFKWVHLKGDVFHLKYNMLQSLCPALIITKLEWRVVVPRLPFQKLIQVPRENVVNVPTDVTNTVTTLPYEIWTMKVQLKRRLCYKSCALSLNIRPQSFSSSCMVK